MFAVLRLACGGNVLDRCFCDRLNRPGNPDEVRQVGTVSAREECLVSLVNRVAAAAKSATMTTVPCAAPRALSPILPHALSSTLTFARENAQKPVSTSSWRVEAPQG